MISTHGKAMDYLDVSINIVDESTTIETIVHHRCQTEPFTLPIVYHLKYPMSMSDWYQTALIRAALTCSSLYYFIEERQYIQVSFKQNECSTTFFIVQDSFFFRKFHVHSSMIVRCDHRMYEILRLRVRDYDQKQSSITWYNRK